MGNYSAHQSKVAVRETPILTRLFMTQYIALFMIILAFLVGAYARRGMEPPRMMEEARTGLPESRALDSEIRISRLFERSVISGERLIEEELEPFVALLQSHDLVMNLDLFARQESNPYEDLHVQMLRRSAEVRGFLAGRG